MGGSLGARRINEIVRESLPRTAKEISNCTFCAEKGNVDTSLEKESGYRQLEYVNEQLPDVLAAH